MVYLYQLCSLRSRTIKSERDCSDYAMSGQHLVSVIIDTVLCYLLLHCDCQMSVRDSAALRDGDTRAYLARDRDKQNCIK